MLFFSILNLELSNLKVISEKTTEDKAQKTYSDISKTELLGNQEPTSLKNLKKFPNENNNKDNKVNETDGKNEIDNMLDKALEQIEKENLPLTYEVLIKKKYFIFDNYLRTLSLSSKEKMNSLKH